VTNVNLMTNLAQGARFACNSLAVVHCTRRWRGNTGNRTMAHTVSVTLCQSRVRLQRRAGRSGI